MSTPEQCKAYRARKKAEASADLIHDVVQASNSAAMLQLAASPKKKRAAKKASKVKKARKVTIDAEGNTVRKASKKATSPNKAQEILTLARRKQGITLTEIVSRFGWQAHTVRGFMSTQAKKGVEITSEKNAAGERVYRIAQEVK